MARPITGYKMNRKICVISGTRAEYGLLKPVIAAIQKDTKLKLEIVAAGMHLAKEFGSTVNLIKKDGLDIAYKVDMNPEKDSPKAMAIALGKGVTGMACAFARIRPDIVLVLGDRTEAFAAAIAASYMNIPVAHIHGGDVTRAGVDESVRHAITKLAHIHFPATRESRERILRMGENPKNVFLVGAPGLDSILNTPLTANKNIFRKYNIRKDEPFIILLQHSVTTQVKDAARQIRQTLEAIKRLKIKTIIIYPNSDSGGRAIIKEIEKCKKFEFIDMYKNIPHIEFLSLLKYASVLVGNSSSGIIESGSLKLPVVNIGIRQDGRQRSGNVIDVPHDRDKIFKAMHKALNDKNFIKRVKRCVNLYGSGHAGERIARALCSVKIDHGLIQKKLFF